MKKTEGAALKYHYDRTKFKNIQTEEDAYWLGFITADGCIVEDHWLCIGLAEKDEEHLKKFCYYLGMSENEMTSCLKSTFGGAYTRDNVIKSVKICSKEIMENLMNKGITPRKSGKEKPYAVALLNLIKLI